MVRDRSYWSDAVLHEKHHIKRTASKVSKGRRLASGDKEKAERVSRNERPSAATIEAAESEAFVASGDKEKAERVSRNERPLAATIEAADAPAGAKPLPSAMQSF